MFSERVKFTILTISSKTNRTGQKHNSLIGSGLEGKKYVWTESERIGVIELMREPGGRHKYLFRVRESERCDKTQKEKERIGRSD